MPANVDALVQEGVAALKAGRRVEAKQALMKAVEIDEQNEQAWLWLSGVVDSLDERQICLENVLALNPANAKAKKGLEATKQEIAAQAGKKKSAPSLPPAAPVAPAPSVTPDPFAAALPDPFGSAYDPASAFEGTGFDSNPYADAPNPFGGSSDPALSGWAGFDASPGPATSVDWGPVDSGPARSSGPEIPQTTEEEYDSWMAGLSFGSGSSGSVPAFDTDFDPGTGAFGSSSSFGSDDFGNTFSSPAKSPFVSDQDPFNQGSDANMFGNFSFDEPLAGTQEADPFGLGSTGDDPFKLTQSSSPFDFGSDPVVSNTSDLGNSYAFDSGSEVDAPFDEFTYDANPEPDFFRDSAPLAPVAASATSSGSAFSFDEPPAVTQKPAAMKQSAPLSAPISASVFTTVDSTPSFSNPSVYFQQIPPEIQAGKSKTKTSGALDTKLVASVLVLLVLSVGSLLILVSNIGH